MSKKEIKKIKLRRTSGLALLSISFGIMMTWIMPGLSILFALVFLILGFYLLFI